MLTRFPKLQENHTSACETVTVPAPCWFLLVNKVVGGQWLGRDTEPGLLSFMSKKFKGRGESPSPHCWGGEGPGLRSAGQRERQRHYPDVRVGVVAHEGCRPGFVATRMENRF